MASIEYPQELDEHSIAQIEACRLISQPYQSVSEELHRQTSRDPLAADLRLSLFVSAAQNFKYESLLKPIPEKFKSPDGEVDIDRLQALIHKFPCLPLEPSIHLDDQVSELLLSVLTPSSHQLTRISHKELVERVTGIQFSAKPPAYCFEVGDSLARIQNWERCSSGHSTFFAFHGSRFENFYSILNLGLHQHLNKKSLFGEGIYLSTEQSVSQMYSSYGEGWSKSKLGQKLAILSLCEVVDHPNVKKGTQRRTGDRVPEKYILVQNNELVRVRYLLVYNTAATASKQLASFWIRHKFIIIIGCYAVLLLMIGLANKGFLSRRF